MGRKQGNWRAATDLPDGFGPAALPLAPDLAGLASFAAFAGFLAAGLAGAFVGAFTAFLPPMRSSSRVSMDFSLSAWRTFRPKMSFT